MRPLQPGDPVGADLRHQVDPVVHDVAGLVVITGGTLTVAVERVEAQLWISTNGAIVPGMPLALMEAAAADAKLVPVALAHPGVERGLGLAHVVGPGRSEERRVGKGCSS